MLNYDVTLGMSYNQLNTLTIGHHLWVYLVELPGLVSTSWQALVVLKYTVLRITPLIPFYII